MTSFEIWRERYYDLESTLEQMVLGFSRVLEEHSESPQSTRFNGLVHIRSLEFVGGNEDPILCCVADGNDLEYKFSFLDAKGSSLFSSSFGRLNSFDLRLAKRLGTAKCEVVVRSKSYPSISDRGEFHFDW